MAGCVRNVRTNFKCDEERSVDSGVYRGVYRSELIRYVPRCTDAGLISKPANAVSPTASNLLSPTAHLMTTFSSLSRLTGAPLLVGIFSLSTSRRFWTGAAREAAA